MTMISAMIGSARSHFRAAGVWLLDDHVLLQGDAREDFWALPGGHVEIMEQAEDAVRREFQEELALGDDIRVERLLWITQNFFHYPEWGGDQHELGLYFLVRPGSDAIARYGDLTRVYPCVEPDSHLTFRWFPLAGLAGAIRPSFLASALCDLPEHPTLITHEGR